MTATEYTHQIVKTFITRYPSAYKSMHHVSHNESTFLSDWHLEGTIWTHTMMVVSEMRRLLDPINYSRPLLLAALLHDIGKVYTQDINNDKSKVTFYGHPGMSTLIARGILDTIDPSLTREQIIHTLRLINYHQLLFCMPILHTSFGGLLLSKICGKMDFKKPLNSVFRCVKWL